jgi:hypothetical protein
MADYNINAVTRRVVFTGSAGVGPYSFTFEVLDQSDLAVYFNATLLTLTTDYTVTVNANGTGSVTIVTGTNVPSTPTASDQIVIVGARDIERTTDFVTAGDLRASALNEQLDSQIIMIQQIAEENRRGMRAPVYDPALVEDGGVVDMELPTKASRAGKTLAFDSDGNPVVGEDIGNWRGDWAASIAYGVRDIVKDTYNSNIYRCNTAHTSSGTAPISGNADVAKWDLVIDATAVADAEAAQAAAEAAQAAAETAETNAATSETNAATSASSASTSATNAATSETNAATSATSAASSATSATASATAASASETAAAASETAAATSETNAATSATNASTSETNAAASASSASTSATNAATSETNAGTSETNAATSATNAATAQTAAEAAQAAAELAADNFDDTYLGAKASDPTVDNDGDALTAGDLYFNTTSDELKYYTGSAWEAISPGITDVVSDTTPQLGGDLDVQTHSIVSTSNQDINITPNGTGNVALGNFTFDADQTVGAGQDNFLMTYDNGAGTISLEAAPAGGAGYFQGENGATGDTTNGKGDIFRVHEQQLDTNTTIASGDNAGAFFSLTVATGVTLTVNGNLVIA